MIDIPKIEPKSINCIYRLFISILSRRTDTTRDVAVWLAQCGAPGALQSFLKVPTQYRKAGEAEQKIWITYIKEGIEHLGKGYNTHRLK